MLKTIRKTKSSEESNFVKILKNISSLEVLNQILEGDDFDDYEISEDLKAIKDIGCVMIKNDSIFDEWKDNQFSGFFTQKGFIFVEAEVCKLQNLLISEIALTGKDYQIFLVKNSGDLSLSKKSLEELFRVWDDVDFSRVRVGVKMFMKCLYGKMPTP